jgi:hypothetical protein
MAFLALLIGAVLIVAAIRNTHGQLLSALGQDVPGFAVWGAAIFGLAVIGFVPGLKPVSRGLLALVIVVIVLTNYRQILGGFQGVWKNAPAQAAGTPAPEQGNDFLSHIAQIGKASGFDFASLLAMDNSSGSTAVNG